MGETRDSRGWLASTGPGALYVVALGFMAAVAITGDIYSASTQALTAALLLGIVSAYLFLQWVDIAAQWLSFHGEVLPPDLSLENRDAARTHAESLDSYQILASRVSHLLRSWSGGWTPSQVLQLAHFQSARLRSALWTGTLFAGITLAPCFLLGERPYLTIALTALLGITVLARLSLLGRVDYFIESNLLSNLPGTIPGTSLSAHDIGDAISGSIDRAFTQLTTQASSEYAKSAGRIEAALTGHVDRLQATNSELAGKLESIMSAEQLQTALVTHIDKLQKTSGALAAKLENVMSADKIEGVLDKHVHKLEATNEQLAFQLSGIMELGKEVEKVFHLQKMVDGTVQSVSASEEFKNLITALTTHLEKSDQLLTEVAKPRTIRLVESDGEIVSG